MGARSSRPSKPAKGSASQSDRVVKATNRRARRNYVIEDTVEAGLVLTGSEVKSLRNATPTLTEGFARIERDELWLYGVHIPPLPQASYLNHEPVRRRKCLMHRRELRKLAAQLDAKGKTLVPLSLYFKGTRVKVELGLGRGRQKGDKRAHEREKEDRKRIRESH
jgi:SsrA-binding protein